MDNALMLIVALLVGLWVGGSFARFNRSRRDLRGTKSLIPGLRKRRNAAGLHSLRAGLLLLGVVFVFFLGLRAAGRI
ncbi:hypothetical protein [Virgisporangium aurantiacum]|uniref:Uncharacterized protein n=1 Tax=Virgisporangium aurantiacum TaxID=175570 RepID=A0A8J3ZF16_9ACTN|nr:hypothetical protein [Virgisporangium aurantiacum]GIJ61608.1 hypothetical protein Vau01_091240 [Virgisporangium aurantiacum]